MMELFSLIEVYPQREEYGIVDEKPAQPPPVAPPRPFFFQMFSSELSFLLLIYMMCLAVLAYYPSRNAVSVASYP